MIHPTKITRRMTKYSAALLAISLLGLVLRVYHLGTQNFWTDEVNSATVAKLALSQIMATKEVLGYPTYYVILHYWINVFGTSEFAIRFLSLIFGVLTIPMIYLLGRRLFNEEVGLISALILAISQFNIQYSQEARMYSMLLLLALLSMYFFVRFLERGSLAISVSYVLSTTLLVFTHTFGLFVLIAQNIFVAGLLLQSSQYRSRVKQWILIQAITLVIFAPWILVLLYLKIGLQGSIATSVNPMVAVLQLAAGAYGEYYARVALLILFLGLAVFSVFTYRRAAQKSFKGYAWEDRKNLAMVCLLFVWFLSVSGLPFLLFPIFSKHFIVTKYLIAASAPLYLLVAKGIRNINYSYAKVAVIAIIVILSAANLQTYYATTRNPTVGNAVNFVNENAESGDLVILLPNLNTTTYYSYRSDLTVKTFPVNYIDLFKKTPDQNMKELTADISGYPRVWIVTYTYDSTKALRELVFDNFTRSYNLTLWGGNISRNPDVRLYVEGTAHNLTINATK